MNLNQKLAGLSLNIGAPAQSAMDLGMKPQAVSGMFMNLPLAEIEFFDKNPRRQHDMESYNHIKESIRSTGIQQPVHVTQRPGENRYILAQGGNTRLKIMRELLEETGEDRFRSMPCFYVAYTNETDLQIAHLIENEQRAEMCFWDKACAYAEIRDMFQEESEKKLSLRELEVMFGGYGLSISYVALSLFFFASDALQELGDYAFELSNAKTADIKKLHTAVLNAAHRLKRDDGFAFLWSDILERWHSQYTDKNLDVDNLISFVRQAFEQEYGSAAFQTASAVKTLNSMQCHETVAATSSLSVTGSETVQTPPAVKAGTATIARHDAVPAVVHGSSHKEDAGSEDSQPQGAARAEVNPPSEAEPSVNCANLPLSAAQYEKKLHCLIRRWLGTVNLSDCFRSHAGFRYGFYIEYPAFEHVPHKDDTPYPYIVDALHPQAGNVFAYLAKLSGQEKLLFDLDDNNNPLLRLPDESKLKIAYIDPDKLDEYNNFGIGDRSNLLSEVLTWQSDRNHPFCSVLDEILAVMRDLNACGEV